MELAKFADVIWDARNSKKTVVAAVSPATVEEETSYSEETALEKAVAALTIHNKRRWQGGRSRGGAGQEAAMAAPAPEPVGSLRGLSAASMISLELMPTSAPTPRHAPGREMSKPGRGSGSHRWQHTWQISFAERQR